MLFLASVRQQVHERAQQEKQVRKRGEDMAAMPLPEKQDDRQEHAQP